MQQQVTACVSGSGAATGHRLRERVPVQQRVNTARVSGRVWRQVSTNRVSGSGAAPSAKSTCVNHESRPPACAGGTDLYGPVPLASTTGRESSIARAVSDCERSFPASLGSDDTKPMFQNYLEKIVVNSVDHRYPIKQPREISVHQNVTWFPDRIHAAVYTVSMVRFRAARRSSRDASRFFRARLGSADARRL